jgi:hypothetical protein
MQYDVWRADLSRRRELGRHNWDCIVLDRDENGFD